MRVLTAFFKYAFTLGFLLIFSVSTKAQDISRVEYFLDNDPGFGLGINIPVPAQQAVSPTFQLNVSSITTGFHNLHIRAYVQPYQVTEEGKTVTKGGWSLTSQRVIYKETLSGNAIANIVKGEYFIDTDPGFNNGTNIPVAAGTNLANVVFSFNPTALAVGFHNLYVRFRDANGKWSVSSVRSFYKENLVISNQTLPNIVKGEYYIDNDPGFGSATAINFTPGANLTNLPLSINLTSLSTGFHNLHFRFQDANGKWSSSAIRRFYKETITPGQLTPDVVKIEYFIDSDPGYGLATNVPITASKNITNLTFAVALGSISPGDHSLVVRARSSNGKWSIAGVNNFKVNFSSDPIASIGNLDSLACAGANFKIPYTVINQFGNTNTFTAQLSNSVGSFNNPINIGTKTGTQSDSVDAVIPSFVGAGAGYRVRLISSSPSDTSVVSSAFRINRSPQPIGISGNNTVCLGLQSYFLASKEAGVTYEWNLSGGGTLTVTNDTAKVNWTTAGTFTLTNTANNECGTYTATLQITVYPAVIAQKPTINKSGDVLFASAAPGGLGIVGYKWFKNGSEILNDNDSQFNVTEAGTYAVRFYSQCTEGPLSDLIGVSLLKENIVAFSPLADKTFGDAPITLSATSTSGLPITFSTSGPASINGSTLTINGAGTVTVFANDAGNEEFEGANAQQSFEVAKADQTISFAPLADRTYGNTAFNPSATATSGLQIAYSSSNPAVADILNGQVRILKTGTVTITAEQPGNVNYNEAVSQSQELVINKAVLTVRAENKVKANGQANPQLTIQYLGFVNGDDAGDLQIAPIVTTEATTSSLPGTYPIVPSGGLSSNYNFTFQNGTLTITSESSLLVFNPLSSRNYGNGDFDPGATSDAGTVSYSSSNTAVAVIQQNKIRIVGIGNTIISATDGTTTLSQNLTVAKAQLTVKADNKIKKSGEANPPLTLTITGFVNGDDINDLNSAPIVGTSAAQNSPAGLYSITPSGGADDLYNFSYLTGTLTVEEPLIPTVDLAVQNVSANKIIINSGDLVNVTWNVANISTNSSVVNWTERIYLQSENGQNRSLIKQLDFANANTLNGGQSLSRTESITVPALNVGDSGVFVVELIPSASIKEVPNGTANNTGIQQNAWSVPKNLSLDLSASQITEGSAESITATVKRTGSITNALTVNISLTQPARFTVPVSVIISAGQAGASFTIKANDNNAVEGVIKDSIIVAATGFASAGKSISVNDNDKPALTFTQLPPEGNEGSTVTFKVNTDLAPSKPLEVFFTSSNQGRFPLPASVIIPAGNFSADVPVNLAQDVIPEIDLDVAITAGAANHDPANASITIKDDDLPGLELVIETDLVAEDAGFYATKATLRRTAKSSTVAFTANLSADVANNLILPASIPLEAGEIEKTFTIGVVDNTLAEGERKVNITASIYVASCGCSAPPESSGSVSVPLSISDNDGPTLQITAAQLTLPEGLTEAGKIRVTRNTNTGQALSVQLTSSDIGEATVPQTVNIPAGQTFVEVPVTTINDGEKDGGQQVYFQATSSGFATGSLWVVVSDQNKPDLQVAAILPVNSVQAMSLLDYQVAVKNTGFATAPQGVLLHGYLSKDEVIDESDSLLTVDIVPAAIPAGESFQLLNAVKAPNLPGEYKLLFQVNPESSTTELLLSNNVSKSVNLTIKPDYTATAVVQPAYFLKGASVQITGDAIKSNGQPAPNENVEVYLITQGLRRTINATTNAAGNYTAQFVPLAKESGHYIVGASFPKMNATEEQDSFDILGLSINNGAIPQFKVVVNQELKGTLPVQNLSNKSLTKFTLAPINLPNGSSISFDTLATLQGNASVNLEYSIKGSALSAGTKFEVVTVQAIADEGMIQQADVLYFCQAPNAFLVADITKINTSASKSKGEQTVQFTLTNKGMGNTGTINIGLPGVNWLVSSTPVSMPSLSPGDSVVVALKFLAAEEIPFNYPVSGSIAISAVNGNSFSIPFTFKKVSETTGTVKVVVTNQFTYFTDDQPKVSGAKVQIKNYFSGEVYAEGTTNAEGEFIAASIPEGKHRVVVEKEKHLPFNGTVTVKPGEEVESSVFLNYQAITFNWSVVPTAVQDEYDITLKAQFETHVPMPVVTIDMPKTMPQLSGDETYAFNATLTNHGLVTAKDVALNLPQNDPEYEFVTNYVPADLLAQQSIQIPIIMRRRGETLIAFASNKESTGGVSTEAVSRFLGINSPAFSNKSAGSNCTDFAGVVYWYKCSISTGLWQKGGTLFSYSGRICSSPPGDRIVDGWNWGYGPGGGGDGYPYCAICPYIGPGTGTSNVPEFQIEKKSCVECIKDMIKAGAKCLVKRGFGCAKAVGKAALTCAGTDVAGFASSKTVNIANQLPGIKGLNNKFTTSSSGQGAVFKELGNNFMLAAKAYEAEENRNTEYFGSMTASDAFATLDSLVKTYVSGLDSILPANQTVILSKMAGYEIQQNTIKNFFTRWNTSIKARQEGVLEPNPQYPAIINWNNVKSFTDSISDATALAKTKGFTSIDNLYDQTFSDMNVILDAQKEAVCASVKIQISQRLTMTREAFEGTLDIFNGHPTDAMDSLSVNLLITDENGVPANGHFEIQTKQLTNIANITGTGIINAQEHGIAKFIFIPELTAAPTEPKEYRFGGSVRYFDPYAQAMVTLPLAGVPLTVNPSPNLALHYFMERNILSDDPLTKEKVEPTVPAELAVMVENQGYGPAVNMTISSAQPKIIENEKGLAIEFKLIGSNFQGQPKNLGVTNINFGTVPGRETRIGQWYLTSSLLGKFVSYEAKVVHNNSFGNPELSLVKSVNLHELTKSIKAYAKGEDDLNDFLVNDIFDVADAPDIIYFSQGNRTEKVYKAKSGSFLTPISAPGFTNTLSVTADSTGWNFIKLNDPGNAQYDIAGVVRSDGRVIPLNNAWLTFVTLPVSSPPVYENKFHFVDSIPFVGMITYTVTWKPRDLKPLNIVRIEGVPEGVTGTQVQKLRAVFNKEIDASTFTFDDLDLNLQGGPDISDNQITITKFDSVSYDIDLSKHTLGNGFYAFTLQAAGISDIYGATGEVGTKVTWSQFLDIPTVQAFEGLPEDKVASAYDTIRVRFNLAVDNETVVPERFLVYKDSVLQAGSVVIDSVHADKKLYYLSGLRNIVTTDGEYEFRVDLPKIQSEQGKFGQQTQSAFFALDNSGPVTVKLQASDEGRLDPQHVNLIDIVFNEEVAGFNIASLKLTRNGELIPLRITQLSNTDLKTWKAGAFGMLTYPEGEYVFKVALSGIKDYRGNFGKDTVQISWTVNRSAQIAVTNLKVIPDLGYSNSDGITSAESLTVGFSISEGAKQITVSQVDLSDEVVLETIADAAVGKVSIPVNLQTGGKTKIRVTALGVNGGESAVETELFIDRLALTGSWQFVNQNLIIQPDTMHFVFSEKLLSGLEFLNALQFRKNGIELAKDNLAVKAISETEYELTGLSKVNDLPGTYELRLNLSKLAKYNSGKPGSGFEAVTWNLLSTNQAPLAKAGTDIAIATPGTFELDGTKSSDPDGDNLTYRWVAPEGVELSDSLASKPSFTISNIAEDKTYPFLLIVNDGDLFSTDAVDVFVKAVVPGTMALSNSSIDENLPTNTLIGSLSIGGSTGYAYSLVAGQGSADNVFFKIEGSELKTLAAFDFENKSSYSVRIKAEKAGSPAIEQAFTITVNDVLEQPTEQDQTISFTALADKTYGDGGFDLTASASSGLGVTYSSSNPAIAEIVKGSQVNILKSGTVTITASQNGNADYNSAPDVSQTLVISQAALTITADDKFRVVGAANPVLTASYSGFVNSETPAVLTTQPVLATTATVGSAVGTYSITVSGANAENYVMTYVAGTLTVQKSATSQTITFAVPPPKTYGNADFTLGAVASSGLPVSYTSSNTSIATIVSGNKVHILQAGTVTITASQSGNGTYNAALDVARDLLINKAMLTVKAENKSRDYGKRNPTFTIKFTGFVNGNTQESLIKLPEIATAAKPESPVGTYVIEVTGAESNNYNFKYLAGALVIKRIPRIFAITPIEPKVYGDPDFAPVITLNTDEEVTLRSENEKVATITDGKIHITGVGTTVITASVPENTERIKAIAFRDSNYTGKTKVSCTLKVNKAPQTISLAKIPDLVAGSDPYTIEVSSSSGLPVTLEVSKGSSLVNLSGNLLTPLKIGDVQIAAKQQGNENYLAAKVVYAGFTVVKSSVVTLVKVHQALSPDGDGVNDFFNIEGLEDYPENTVTLFNPTGKEVFKTKNYDNKDRVFIGKNNNGESLPQGTYFYMIEYTLKGKREVKTGYFVLKY